MPFGEYVPLRSLFSHFADLSGVPVDAIPGHGTGFLRTPAGPLGLLVSFEVFYAGRGRRRRCAPAPGSLAVPTNTSSYGTSQVPTQETAAAIVQAVETGRDLVQAAPTGFSTVVTQRGVVNAPRSAGARCSSPPSRCAAASRPTTTGGTSRCWHSPHWRSSPGGCANGLLVVTRVDVDARHAGRHVHRVVGRIVLEGEPQVETVDPEILHYRLLELGDLGVVAA